jgi:hypothetical protein
MTRGGVVVVSALALVWAALAVMAAGCLAGPPADGPRARPT